MHALGRHLVPAVWKKLLPEDFLYFRFPDEVKATCADCPMICSQGYHPDIKCCSHIPRVPNFALGQMLNDKRTANLVEALVAEGFSSPEGVQQTPGQAAASITQNANNKFGKNSEVVCRFLDRNNGSCQIYAYRNSVCSTFFCVNDHKDGEDFWLGLQAVVGQIEAALSQWAMAEIGFNTQRYFQTLDEFNPAECYDENSLAWTDATLKKMWGDWFGRECDFYRKCADLIEGQKDLFSIACKVKLLQPAKFELAIRSGLSERNKIELDSEGPVAGEPMSIEDLWYELKVAQTHLAREMSGV